MIIIQLLLIFLLPCTSLTRGKANNLSKASLNQQKQQQQSIGTNDQKALVPLPLPLPSKSLESDNIYRHTIIRETIYVPAASSHPTSISSSSSSSSKKDSSSLKSPSFNPSSETAPAHILDTLKGIYYILSHPVKLTTLIVPFLSYQFYNLIYYIAYFLYLTLLYLLYYPVIYIGSIIIKPFLLSYRILTSPLIITALSALLCGSIFGAVQGYLTGSATKSLILETANLSVTTLNKIKKIGDWFLGSNARDVFQGSRGRSLQGGKLSQVERIDVKGKGRAMYLNPVRTITDSSGTGTSDSRSRSESRSDSWEEFNPADDEGDDDGDETEDTVRGDYMRGGSRRSGTGGGGGIILRREGMFR